MNFTKKINSKRNITFISFAFVAMTLITMPFLIGNVGNNDVNHSINNTNQSVDTIQRYNEQPEYGDLDIVSMPDLTSRTSKVTLSSFVNATVEANSVKGLRLFDATNNISSSVVSSTTGEGADMVYNPIPLGQKTFDITGLDQNTAYTFNLQSSATGVGDWTDVTDKNIIFMTEDVAYFSDLSIASNTLTNNSVTLNATFEDSTNTSNQVTEVKVMSSSGISSQTITNPTDGATLSFEITGLSAITNYDFNIYSKTGSNSVFLPVNTNSLRITTMNKENKAVFVGMITTGALIAAGVFFLWLYHFLVRKEKIKKINLNIKRKTKKVEDE